MQDFGPLAVSEQLYLGFRPGILDAAGLAELGENFDELNLAGLLRGSDNEAAAGKQLKSTIPILGPGVEQFEHWLV